MASGDPKTEPTAPSRAFWRGMTVILLLAACVRIPLLTRGIEIGPPALQWREADQMSVARNFQREGMDIAYPRVDWRGRGPGFVEMDFPAVSWLIAAGPEVQAGQEQFGRVLSFTFGLLAILVFAMLARALLASPAALAATAFLAFNPLFIQASTAIIPEPLMLLGCVACAYALWRWLKSDAWTAFAVAAVCGALAILAKSPAAHLPLLVLGLTVGLRGVRGLRDVRVWVLIGLMLAPAIGWRLHANQLWLEHGNSLIPSSHAQATEMELVALPEIFRGLLSAELVHVWRGGAAVVGLFAIVAAWTLQSTRLALLWFGAAMIGLGTAALASGQPTYVYDHVIAIPAAALLLGSGISAALVLHPGRRTPAVTAAGFTAVAVLSAAWWQWGGFRPRLAMTVTATAATGATIAALWWFLEWSRSAEPLPPPEPAWRTVARRVDCVALIAAAAVTCTWSAVAATRVLARPAPNELYACSRLFAPHVPPSALLLSSNGGCLERGGQLSNNMPFFFYWMDRKGSSVCLESQSIAAIEEYAANGAEFFTVDQASLDRAPELGEQLQRRFDLLSSCSGASLFDLRGPPAASLR